MDELLVLENVPLPQGRHWRSTVEVPDVSTYSPAAHTVHGVHAVASAAPENVPEGHEAHARFIVALGAVDWYIPAVQFVDQGVHIAALVVVENDPEAQALQVRSVVGVPATET